MERKIKILMVSILLSGLVAVPVAAFARDDHHEHHDHRSHNRWDYRADRRNDYRAREQARQQLDYDLSHHASRKRLAQDDARVRESQREIRRDRRGR